ncbi:phage/plasmid primase, P4 family [Leuconostoc mesenteroides]|uniref:phage/plasmid primase, P4 family n=1 Tax=Leuconostoc mesenteroides TaxID=1245 RepID=UPI0023609C9F|nr:phage/plasmid primase, P4 family [Leuconostoc mesenteroides]
MTELKKKTTETEEKPTWLITDEDGVVKVINALLLSKTILDKHPVIGVPFAGDVRYYQFDGISWKNAKEKSIRINIEKLALKELEKYNAFNVKRMSDVGKTSLVNSIKNYNPFQKQPENVIAFKNGTYDIKNNTQRINRSHDYIVNGHNINLKIDGKAPNIEAWGNYLFGNSWQFIKELLGYAFIPEYKTFNTIAVMVDEVGGTGKSYFFSTIVNELLGNDNIVSKDMDTIAGSNGKSARFGLVGLYEKLSNIHLDLPDTRIDVPDVLRSLSGGDRIDVEGKNADSVSLTFYALLLFGANQVPNIAINNALSQRIKIIPVTAPRVRDRPDEQAKRAKLWSEEEAIKELGAFAYTVLQAYKQAKQRGAFSISDEMKVATKEWNDRQDLVTMFLRDAKKEPIADAGGATKEQTWLLFEKWLDENRIKSKIQRKQFEAQMKKLGYVSVRKRKHQSAKDSINAEQSWDKLNLDQNFNQ